MNKILKKLNTKEVPKYKLRPGDALVNQLGLALLVRGTRSYWYYLFRGHSARIKKTKAWESIDSGFLKVSYGSTLKNRRKNRKNRILDLHGVSHSHAADQIRDFLNFIELPCKVVTGKSEKMKKILHELVEEYGWLCREESAHNSGAIIIFDSEKQQ